jgi:Ca2+-binding EF-hand superfamily protein
MMRAVAVIGALLFSSTTSAAQAPCTTDASRVVSEIYRHVLERAPDAGSAGHIERLSSGKTSVRDLVRAIVTSTEHTTRFFPSGMNGDARIQAAGTLYRHVLGRQPDAGGARDIADLAASRGVNAAVENLMASAEYQEKFGENGVPGSGGLRYCGSEADRGVQAAAPAPAMRFHGMDQNSDGVIARSEWRGSAQSFRVHDWNRDGVLSGDEVREGADRPNTNLEDQDFDPTVDDQLPVWSEASFAQIDRNRDGRIRQNEWRHDVETFRRVDGNRDGWLSKEEFVVTGAEDDRDDRFEYLDANTNGRIERSEWHGGHDAFDALDRNNDDTLSRAEVGGNASGKRDRFAVLDADRSGKVSRDEWQWSRKSFDDRDVNRDGQLTRREFNGGGVGTSGRD